MYDFPVCPGRSIRVVQFSRRGSQSSSGMSIATDPGLTQAPNLQSTDLIVCPITSGSQICHDHRSKRCEYSIWITSTYNAVFWSVLSGTPSTSGTLEPSRSSCIAILDVGPRGPSSTQGRLGFLPILHRPRGFHTHERSRRWCKSGYERVVAGKMQVRGPGS